MKTRKRKVGYSSLEVGKAPAPSAWFICTFRRPQEGSPVRIVIQTPYSRTLLLSLGGGIYMFLLLDQ